MLLSLATIYAVPLLILLDTLNPVEVVATLNLQGPRSIHDLPWINHESSLLLQYQWNCFIAVIFAVFCNSARASLGSRPRLNLGSTSAQHRPGLLASGWPRP